MTENESKTTESEPNTAPASSLEVRERLVETLKLDLVGPWPDHELAEEKLAGWQRPSAWYLTGFLIPSAAPPDQASDDDSDDDFEDVDREGLAEENSDERTAAKKSFFPSSMGLSFLTDPTASSLTVRLRWGDYERAEFTGKEGDDPIPIWQRTPRDEELQVDLKDVGQDPRSLPVPNSNGLQLTVVARDVDGSSLGGKIPEGVRSVSAFLVNHRVPDETDPDTAFIFQPELLVTSDPAFVARPNLRGLRSGDWDEDVADLHFADTPDYATGHGVSANWDLVDQQCFSVRTEWIPSAEVEHTETFDVEGVELGMDTLGNLTDGPGIRTALQPLVDGYQAWIEKQREGIVALDGPRKETAEQLLVNAETAARRIDAGLRTLETDPDALDAFKMANRAVAAALKKRLGIEAPRWRSFQIAFLLLNLSGAADPTDANRETVDLLFFPTGGGKTEAYLGLAAFSMVLRRLRNPGDEGRGVSVIMRYTLRLLTLDQLGRAAGLVCALELERQDKPDRYGDFPFEIGLWVGKAATPNVIGRKGEKGSDSARSKTIAYKNNPERKPAPVPIEQCPWCGAPFKPASFILLPNDDAPTEMRVVCADFECEFSGDNPLPILTVDDVIYKRLPAFLIATVDKFATLPWIGASGNLLGRSHWDGRGAKSLPPDLIIQDELHLIAGPLGTMAGLYETVVEALGSKMVDGDPIRPKLVASTATVRRAQDQVQALFGRAQTHIFPPPGPSLRDSFFAQTKSPEEVPARRYVGIGAPGRAPKVALRRTWTALMSAAQYEYMEAGGYEKEGNSADPYMTVLGYFNSLRELGGSRRILEEEVQNTLKEYGYRRVRIGDTQRLFRDRRYWKEVVELTSRVSTNMVSKAKERLGAEFGDQDNRVDCAIATNMISVGLDISRLGLMVVFGQPKTHSEYIQATSRVGRAKGKPGLVITLLNVHKPRDRSHYERFRQYHETFYRMVEVASVTPFSARALDRGLPGALIALARHWESKLNPAKGVEEMEKSRPALESTLLTIFEARVRAQSFADDEERDEKLNSVRHRINDLLDSWINVVGQYRDVGESVSYQKHEVGGNKTGRVLLRDMLDRDIHDPHQAKFRVNRSLRDVEPAVKIDVIIPGQSGTGGQA